MKKGRILQKKYKMKIFLDSIDLKEITKYIDIIDGVTTTPSLALKAGVNRNYYSILRDIGDILTDEQELHACVLGDTLEENLEIINEIQEKNKVYKVPVSFEIIELMKESRKRLPNAKFGFHLVYNYGQVLLAEKIRAKYIYILLGRMKDLRLSPYEFITKSKFVLCNTEIIVTSIRDVAAAEWCIVNDLNISVPFKVLENMLKNKYTEIQERIFKKDLVKLNSENDNSILNKVVNSDYYYQDESRWY